MCMVIQNKQSSVSAMNGRTKMVRTGVLKILEHRWATGFVFKLNKIVSFFGVQNAFLPFEQLSFKKKFYWSIQLIYSVLDSGVLQNDSVIHIHIFILFQILFPYRLSQNIKQSPLCYTIGPCWLSILHIQQCLYVNSKLLVHPFPHHTFPLW